MKYFLCILLLAIIGAAYAASNRDPVCSEPLFTGGCRAAFNRYGYNSKTGKCERFVYGGCGANGNNFKTLKACQAKCGQK